MSFFDKMIVASMPLVPKFIIGRVAARYVAGETLDQAVELIKRLNGEGAMATVDLPQPVFSVELGKGETPFRNYLEVYRRVRCDALNIIAFEDVPFEEKKEALARSRQYLENLFAGEGA